MTKSTCGRSNRSVVQGGGIISTVLNKAIDLLPLEVHLPGYQWCGPGTNVARRLARGDKGINPLDEACKIHDITYSKFSDSENRREADKKLASQAWARVTASDSSVGERAAALAVSAAMKAKTALGGGRKKRKSQKRKKRATKAGQGLYLRPYSKRGEGIVRKKKVKRTKKKKR